jgi:hypothetical protein
MNDFVGIFPDLAAYQHRNEEHYEDLGQKVRELLAENPEYREKVLEYAAAKNTYDAAEEADWEESIFTKLSNWLGFQDD